MKVVKVQTERKFKNQKYQNQRKFNWNVKENCW